MLPLLPKPQHPVQMPPLVLGDIVATLGENTFDIHLNENAFWRNVPAAVWTYKLGGYQVLKKWLSYREIAILERPLKPEEIQYFTDAARRVGGMLMVNTTNAY